MSRKRMAVLAGAIAVTVWMISIVGSTAGAAPAMLLRGVIGGDYHGVTSAGGDDWGALASLRIPALTGIRDADVAVVDDGAPAGVTSSDEGDSACTGTFGSPTAPPDEVCIYISNGDNAVDVHGVSIFPGTSSGSKFGFKIVWSTPVDDADTFVEASWAYNKPATP